MVKYWVKDIILCDRTTTESDCTCQSTDCPPNLTFEIDEKLEDFTLAVDRLGTFRASHWYPSSWRWSWQLIWEWGDDDRQQLPMTYWLLPSTTNFFSQYVVSFSKGVCFPEQYIWIKLVLLLVMLEAIGKKLLPFFRILVDLRYLSLPTLTIKNMLNACFLVW